MEFYLHLTIDNKQSLGKEKTEFKRKRKEEKEEIKRFAICKSYEEFEEFKNSQAGFANSDVVILNDKEESPLQNSQDEFKQSDNRIQVQDLDCNSDQLKDELELNCNVNDLIAAVPCYVNKTYK